MRTCKATTKAGKSCRSPAMLGAEYCFTHNPEMTNRHREGSRKGGRAGKLTTLPPGSPDVPLQTAHDVAAFIGMTMNQVRRGDIDARTANCLGILSGHLLRAFEQGQLADRIAALEQRLSDAAE